MPYNYHESTKLSRENALALKSLSATGELPKDHYWNALRAKHDANPTRFDRANAVLGALLDRDQSQRLGTATASSPLFPASNFIKYALGKHDLNSLRFDRWHPFLGRLFEIKLPTAGSTAGETLTGGDTPPPPNPPGGLNPPGGTTGGGGGVNPAQQGSVPEPASALMMGLAIACTLAAILARRKFRGRQAARPALA